MRDRKRQMIPITELALKEWEESESSEKAILEIDTKMNPIMTMIIANP
jgi:hypothetical protein